MADLVGLDPKQEEGGDEGPQEEGGDADAPAPPLPPLPACPITLQADLPAAQKRVAKKEKGRGGLLSVTASDGTCLASLILPWKQWERNIYHWMLLVACNLLYGVAYATIDVACRLKLWLPRVDGYSGALQPHLEAAAQSCLPGQSLRSAVEAWADQDPVPQSAMWLRTHLSDAKEAAAALNKPLKVELCAIARIWRGFIFLLEVYGGIGDVDINGLPSVEWPRLSLDGVKITLNAMHAYGHGDYCRILNDCRSLLSAGRADGEQVERWNAYVGALIGRAAKASIQETKQYIAELHRFIAESKITKYPGWIARRVLQSRKHLVKYASKLWAMALELESTTIEGSDDAERIARKDLSAAAKQLITCPETGRPSGAALESWARHDTTIKDSNTVIAAIVARMLARENKSPRLQRLQNIIACVVIGSANAELQAAVTAVGVATGTNSFTVKTVKSAVRAAHELVLPVSLPQDEGDALANKLRGLLDQAALPAGLMPAGGTGFDPVAIVSFITMVMLYDELGQLGFAIMKRKEIVYGPSGNEVIGRASIGAAGAQTQWNNMKLERERLMKKKNDLWKWVRRWNVIVAAMSDCETHWATLKEANQQLPSVPWGENVTFGTITPAEVSAVVPVSESVSVSVSVH